MLEEQRKPSNAFMEECTIDAPILEEQRKPSSFHGKHIQKKHTLQQDLFLCIFSEYTY